MDLNPAMKKKAAEEVGSGEGQTPFNEMFKNYDLVHILLRKRLAGRRSPLDQGFLLKQTLRNKIHKVFAGALTSFPVGILLWGFLRHLLGEVPLACCLSWSSRAASLSYAWRLREWGARGD